MPIDAELRRALYNTREWREARERVRRRAGYQCECRGHCGLEHRVAGGRCDRLHSNEKPLTVAHVDHDTGAHVPDEKLMLLCPGCHLRYDEGQHQQAIIQRRGRELEQRGQRRLL